MIKNRKPESVYCNKIFITRRQQMNITQFDKFSQACSKELATTIGTILELVLSQLMTSMVVI